MISPGFASIEEASAAPVIVGLRIEPLSAEIAVDAAIIRGSRRIGLADAIHLATARAGGQPPS